MTVPVWAWVAVLSGDAVIFLLLAPIIPVHPYPYCTRAEGYGSVSAYLFYNGVIYFNRQFGWITHALSNFVCW